MRLTVCFDGQFWVGIFEEERAGGLAVFRHVFGPEPGCQEILTFVQETPPLFVGDHSAEPPQGRLSNPKRLAREAARAMAQRGVSTKSQEAMRLAIEERKSETRVQRREERDAERARKRAIARSKALKRHRGH
jgi:hypothetical protein